jgi:hypothetical protein
MKEKEKENPISKEKCMAILKDGQKECTARKYDVHVLLIFPCQRPQYLVLVSRHACW